METKLRKLSIVLKNLVLNNWHSFWLFELEHEPLALERRLIRKISKHHFFQDIINSFYGVTQMGLEPHQNFFQNIFRQIWLLEEFNVFAY